MPGNSPGLVVFLVEPPGRSPGVPYIDTLWGEQSRDLRLVVESIKPERIEVYIAGSPPRLVVPATKDVPGALLLLDAGSADYDASKAGAFETSVETVRVIASRSDTEVPCAVVVVSPRTEPEIDAAANPARDGPPVIFVRSTLGKGPPGYRAQGPNAQWMRLDLPEPLRAFAGNLSHQHREPVWPGAQVLALTAFLALYLEGALRLSWSYGAGLRCRMLRHLFRRGKPAEEGPSPEFSGSLLLVMICLAAGYVAASPADDASHRISLESITPHIAVVTEVSDEEPYVGQQFSVIYKLRCSIPPTAVDVDPQDFTGFWTVTAPAAGQARPEPVTLSGRPATDFLLRQLIVFPLRPGRQALPPLRLKIKEGASSRDDWDLTRHTRAVGINVRPVPVTEGKRDAFFMVGSLDVRLSNGDPDNARESVLEVRGTANLDFFRPEQWLKSRDEQPLLIRLRDAESLVQTRDYEGKRRLTLLQRRKWSVRVYAGESAGTGIEPFRVPFFDPEASGWRSVEVPVFVPRTGTGTAQARNPDSEVAGPRQLRGRVTGFSPPVIIAFAVSCLALLAVMIAGRRRGTVETGSFPISGRQQWARFAEARNVRAGGADPHRGS
jgi:hypothetical protein